MRRRQNDLPLPASSPPGRGLAIAFSFRHTFEQRESSALLFRAVEEDAAIRPPHSTICRVYPSRREALKKVSTATLTTVLFKRGLRNVFIQGIFLLNRDAPRMVGEAYTLRYIPAREDIDQLGAFEGRGHPQREAIEACPPGQVLVMDARRDASAATGGDILMTRLMVRGVAGVVTDGGLRDSPIDREAALARVLRRALGAAQPGAPPRGGEPGADRLRRRARSIRATWWSATQRAWSSSRRTWPTRSPRKPPRRPSSRTGSRPG